MSECGLARQPLLRHTVAPGPGHQRERGGRVATAGGDGNLSQKREGRPAPERRCVACGRRAQQRELLRVHLDTTTTPPRVVPDTAGPRTGRGAYLCLRQACADQAVRRRAFQRSFRRTVTVDVQELLGEIDKRAQGHTR